MVFLCFLVRTCLTLFSLILSFTTACSGRGYPLSASAQSSNDWTSEATLFKSNRYPEIVNTMQLQNSMRWDWFWMLVTWLFFHHFSIFPLDWFSTVHDVKDWFIYIYNYIQLYTYYDYNILWLYILDGKLRMILHQPSISKVCKPITTCHRSPLLLITIWVSRKWTDFCLECLAFQSGQQRSSGSSLVFDVSWCFLNWFEVWVLQRSSSFFCVLLLHQIDQETKLWDLIFDHVCIFLFRNMFFYCVLLLVYVCFTLFSWFSST